MDVLQSRLGRFDKLWPACGGTGQCCSKDVIIEAEIIVLLCVRWYLRFALSFRNLEEIMAERNLSVDHVTIWGWVQRYAPELNRRCRRESRVTNRSWRVDETHCRVAGKWTYLYRAVDSTGATIDFLLSATRDAAAAKRFLQNALHSAGHPRPRVINLDGNPSYPTVIAELRQAGELGRRCRCRPVRYLNNILNRIIGRSSVGSERARDSGHFIRHHEPFRASKS
jgi:transposase, IS6 family